jgi:hypothetical protein
VDVERVGEWWNLRFADVDFVYAQTRGLDQVEAAARRALSLKLEVPQDSFELDIRLQLPAELSEARDAVRESREAAEAAQQAASDRTRELVRTLVRQRFTVRDIGEIIGLSPQRVSQLARHEPSPRRSVHPGLEMSGR